MSITLRDGWQGEITPWALFCQRNKTGLNQNKTGSKTGSELDGNLTAQLDRLSKTGKTDKTGLTIFLRFERDTHVCVYYTYIKDRSFPVLSVLSVLKCPSSWGFVKLAEFSNPS